MDAVVSYCDFPSHKRVHCSKHSSSWRPFMALIMEVWPGGWQKGHFWEMTRWRRVVKLCFFLKISRNMEGFMVLLCHYDSLYVCICIYMFWYWIYSTHHPPKNSSQKKWTAKLRDTVKYQLHRPACVVSIRPSRSGRNMTGAEAFWRDLISC